VIEAIATSATADLLVWVTTATAAMTFTAVLYLVRVTLQNRRILRGEATVESDGGVVGMVNDHERQIEAHDRMLARLGYKHKHGEREAEAKRGD